jgi:copper transport protein
MAPGTVIGRLAIALWLVAAWILLSCSPALAHATLIEASPPQRGTVSKPPDRVELRFSEPVDAGFDPVAVRDAEGTRVDEHDARVDPEDVRVVLADLEELPEGAYEVEWRVTSIDGHVVEGRYVFAVAGPIGPDESGAHGNHARGTSVPRVEDRNTEHPGHEPALKHHGGQSGHEAPGPQESAATEHGLVLAATALLAGLAPFVTLVWLPASRQTGAAVHGALRPFGVLAWALLCVLVVAGVGELSSYAVRASGEPLGTGLFAQTLFGSRVGEVWLIRLALALLTAAAITAAAGSGRTWEWGVATATGGLLLMSLTGLSHAAATGRFLPFVADWTHAVAAAVWMGGLLGFVVTLFFGPVRDLPPDRQAKLRERSVRRFSAVATIAVAVLATTGLYAILLHVPSPQALVDTPYGRALLVKLGLLALVLSIGARNLLLRGRGPFGRLLVVELLLALGLFVATGFLTSLPPASGM